MGSVNANPVRLGANAMLAAPTPSDLWLAVYGGEVLTWFDELNISSMFVRRKTIFSGSTAEFPLLHQFEAERHAIGTEMLGQDMPRGLRTLSLDDRPLVVPYEVDDIDRMLAHFDDRAEMAKQAGSALARKMDKFNFRLLLNAARTSADAAGSPFPGGGIDQDGGAVTSSSFPSTATGAWDRAGVIAFLEALETVEIEWAERDYPEEGRNVAVPFKLWWKLRNLGMPRAGDDITLRDWSMGVQQVAAGAPQYSAPQRRANALSFNGLPIWGSNHLPNGQNITTDEPKYRGDFTATRAVMGQEQAVGHLTLLDVVTETDRDVRRGVDFFVTKVLTGGGTLRPEVAIEFQYVA
jgi:hypothetical protein